MSRPILKNIYKLTAEELARQIGKSPGAVREWRHLGKLPVNPVIRARYLELEKLVAGPSLQYLRKVKAKSLAKKNNHAK